MKTLRLAVMILLPLLSLTACAWHNNTSGDDEAEIHGMTLTGKNQ